MKKGDSQHQRLRCFLRMGLRWSSTCAGEFFGRAACRLTGVYLFSTQFDVVCELGNELGREVDDVLVLKALLPKVLE